MSLAPQDGGRSVFISYASDDGDRASLLCMHLEHEGISCWMAPRDIPPGRRYAEGILQGIEECTVFLVLFSRAANQSAHVPNEIEEGASRNKPILLVRLDETDPSANRSLSLFLRSHQWFDASRGQLSTHAARLTTDIRRLLDVAEKEAAAKLDPHPDLSVAVPAIQAASALVEAQPPSDAPRSIGIEVGATKIRGCVIDLGNPDIYATSVTEPLVLSAAARNPRGVLDGIKTMVKEILDTQFTSTPPVGIGVAVPGQVDLRAGTLKFGPNLYGARNLSFKTYLSGAFPRIPIRVDNEVRCATRAELHLGVGKQFDSFACIFIGTGVGSGTVIDRRIHFGHNFCAGEIGHTKIALSGPPCACGQIGCLETFVKAQAIVTRARAKAIDWQSRGRETLLSSEDDSISPESIVQAIESGDDAAIEVANEVGANLGLGIANYLNLVNPAAVVIGGGLMTGFFFHMIAEISDAVQRNGLAEVANTPIVQSAHTDDGIAMGAALMFHEHDGWPFP